MKAMNRILGGSLAALLLAAPLTVRGGDLLVKVKGIRSHQGQILVGTGDVSQPEKMRGEVVAATADSVECRLRDAGEGALTLYVFHDANGNYRMDTDEQGRPAEGCARVQTDASAGEVTVELYYFDEKPQGEALPNE